VSIGEDLAEARRRAGLTVTQISQRTCIRQAIIAGIERDEFGACGGDFYARGHIRAIAQVVGADPGPLIAEYDAAHRAAQPVTTADLFRPARPARMPARHRAGWATVLGLALAAAVGLAAYHVITTSRHAGSPLWVTRWMPASGRVES
jgi:cytoskeletal protein RodZ